MRVVAVRPASWPIWLTSKLACQALIFLPHAIRVESFDCAKLWRHFMAAMASAPDPILVTILSICNEPSKIRVLFGRDFKHVRFVKHWGRRRSH